MNLENLLKSKYKHNKEGIYLSDYTGYWSNLSKEENAVLMESLKSNTAREAILQCQPWLEDVIFSAKRPAGLELLQLKGDEVCIDYGCMWGALTVPLAKRTKFVLGIDQTLESLQFLNARLRDEGLDNVALLRNDLRKMPVFVEEDRIDVAIVNGVLEWIPEVGDIELNTYFGKRHVKSNYGHPGEQQESFLRRIYQNLSQRGKLYVAIENRFDFKMFLGVKDPHSNTLFTSVFPRKVADWISLISLGRPYINWIYSFKGIASLLQRIGFSKVDLYMCFPDYRYPERIIPYNSSLENYQPTISRRNAKGKTGIKRLGAHIAELIIFRYLKIKALAPSIIAIGCK
jgi:hypothetical protein